MVLSKIKLITLVSTLIINYKIECCCFCLKKKNPNQYKTDNNNQRFFIDPTKTTEINEYNFLTNNKTEKKITLNQEQEEFSKKINNILPEDNKYDFNAEQIILLHEFTNGKGIKNINNLEIEYMPSSMGCIKINIDGNICYIKEQSKLDKFYFDVLTEIGLIDFKYYFTDNYILTEHVDQNINNLDINEEYLVLGKNLDTTKFETMISKIKNFKEYNFFCALLGLVDCDLIYRLDNSYFKKDGDKYKVFLLDIYNGRGSIFPDRNDVHANKFYNVLTSNTKLLTAIQNSDKNFLFMFDTDKYNANLISRAISFTVHEQEINLFDENTNIIEKYSNSGKVDKNSNNIIHALSKQVNNKNFINYTCDEKNTDVIYRPKKNYTDKSYPKDITYAIYDMFEDIIKKNPGLNEEEQEKNFIDYILPILFKTLITEEIIDSHKKHEENKYFTDLKTFKEEFYKNYPGNKDNLTTVNRYYLDLYRVKPKIFDEIMKEENFSNEENENIKNKLIKLINFVHEHENEYDSDVIQKLKKNFRFLKDNNMYRNIIYGIDL